MADAQPAGKKAAKPASQIKVDDGQAAEENLPENAVVYKNDSGSTIVSYS